VRLLPHFSALDRFLPFFAAFRFALPKSVTVVVSGCFPMNVATFEQLSTISLTPSPSLHAVKAPQYSISSSSKDYILHLSALGTTYAAAFSSPSNSISLLEKTSLQLVASFKAHTDAITCLRSSFSLAGSAGKSILLSSGKDGLVKVWDDRTQAINGPILQCQNYVLTLRPIT
jgi:WD40 repeat protein